MLCYERIRVRIWYYYAVRMRFAPADCTQGYYCLNDERRIAVWIIL